MNRTIKETLVVVALAVFTALALFAPLAAFAEPTTEAKVCIKNPVIYTRQPRQSQPITTPGFAPVGEGANWQHWYDAGMPNRFTESDLVQDDRCGNIEVLFNCTTDNLMICAAHDARPSPDNRLIAFTVARGGELISPKAFFNGPPLHKIEFAATSYEIWIHDRATKQNRLLERDARMPDWPSNAELVFASSRAGTWPAWAHHGDDYKAKELNIFRGLRVDGKPSTLINLTPGKFCMNPAVMTTGQIVMSCWNGQDPRKIGTPANAWWPEIMEGNGTRHRVLANAHGSTNLKTTAHLVGVVDPKQKGVGSTEFRVLRPCTEIWKGKVGCTNYYRNNHIGGMGIIFGMSYTSPAEGSSLAANILEATHPSTVPGSGRYTPQVRTLTPYGHDSDDAFRRDLKGRIMGKAGYAAPAPTAEGEYLFTNCFGTCYEATMPDQANRAFTGGIPTAHHVIMLAKRAVITDPFDPAQVEIIACADEQWNCRDARFLVSYSELFGQPEPDPSPTRLTGTTTTLRVVDARKGELIPIPGPNTKPEDSCAKQGCAEPGWQARIAAIRIDKVFSHTVQPKERGFAATATVATCPLEKDGSLECVIPCGITYQLRGVDAAGVVVATDHSLHVAVCGEVVTCHGCHDAHSEERLKELEYKTPEERFKATAAGC